MSNNLIFAQKMTKLWAFQISQKKKHPVERFNINKINVFSYISYRFSSAPCLNILAFLENASGPAYADDSYHIAVSKSKQDAVRALQEKIIESES
jgi:hypothetical protein